MPQMAPMNWLFMFFIFSIALFISVNKFFFFTQTNTSYLNLTESNSTFSNLWKW